jgi:hypothetical protein
MIGQPDYSARSAIIQVRDPQNGEILWLTAYLRNDRLVLQRLRGQIGTDKRSPKQLMELIRFGRAAYGAFDQPMSGKLPPAAERVAATRRIRHAASSAGAAKAKRKRPHPFNPAYYRTLLGGPVVGQIEARLRAFHALTGSR